MDKTTDTKAAPIYRYRVVIKGGKAIVERRVMRLSQSRHDIKPHLLPIRDWTSHEFPESETLTGAIEAARRQADDDVQGARTAVDEAQDRLRTKLVRQNAIDVLEAK